MAKKQYPAPREDRAAADYYKLNTQAVEDLVTANEENSPPVSEEELRRYQSGPRVKMATWVKIILIKAWFAGAVCFFFLWGLGLYISNQLDQIVITCLTLGTATDLLTNNVIRFLERTPRAHHRFLFVTRRGFWSLPLNILYGSALTLCVVMTYDILNRALVLLTGSTGVPLGVGPILFGVFVTAWDALFLCMKHTLARIVSDAKKSAP